MIESKARIVIAGGGIGGMASALALLRNGHDVEIVEQAMELKEVGAGIQISPNGARVLDHLGVFETLKGMSTRAERKDVRLWSTGRVYPAFEFGPEAVRRYGYPYLTVYRPDLLQVLIDAVRALRPDAITLHARAAGYAQDGEGVTLMLENGTTRRGDLLIGADGVHSRIRAQMVGETEAQYTGMVVWRSVIPMNLLPDRFREPVANAWMGPHGHILQYPLRNGEAVNFVATIERETWTEESWTELGTSDECARDFAGWHEDVQTLIRAMPTLNKWALMSRSTLSRWTDGRVALLGDACHPTLPLLAQGAVMAIEDAVVLARSIARHGATPEALRRYEAVRVPIARAKVEGAQDNLPRFHNDAYASEQTAGPFIEAAWGRQAIEDRYDWIYRDDATAVSV